MSDEGCHDYCPLCASEVSPHHKLTENYEVLKASHAALITALEEATDWLGHHLTEFDPAAHSPCVYEYHRCVVHNLAHDCEIAKGYAVLALLQTARGE